MGPDVANVVIPAAGRGTRLLAATRSTPSVLFDAHDRPILEFAIDEAVDPGADRILVRENMHVPAFGESQGPAAPM